MSVHILAGFMKHGRKASVALPTIAEILLADVGLSQRRLIHLAVFIALLLIMQGILGLAAPEIFVRVIRFFQTPPAIYVAAVLRVTIGLVLVCAASASRGPRFLRSFGFIIVIGGMLTPFIGIRSAHLGFD